MLGLLSSCFYRPGFRVCSLVLWARVESRASTLGGALSLSSPALADLLCPIPVFSSTFTFLLRCSQQCRDTPRHSPCPCPPPPAAAFGVKIPELPSWSSVRDGVSKHRLRPLSSTRSPPSWDSFLGMGGVKTVSRWVASYP